MAQPTVTRLPYELLVRWMPNDDNVSAAVRGASIRWLDVIVDGGGNVKHSDTDPEPIDIGQGKGYPFADILEALHVDTLAGLAEAQREIAAERASYAALQAEHASTTQALNESIAAATAEKTSLAAEIVRLDGLLEQERVAGKAKDLRIAEMEAALPASVASAE